LGINVDKAKEVVESSRGAGYERYPFWQPPADLHEHVKFLSEPRTINTKHGPCDVVDVERPDQKSEKRCMNLTKVALTSQIKRHLPLAGKMLVIVGLGKPKDKKYFDFYVADEAQAAKDGVVERLEKVQNQTISRGDLETYVSALVAGRRP
jgi:hypothetical protein